MAASLRSHGQLLDPDVNFPKIATFNEPTKLPTYKSVIGVLRFLTENKHSHSSSVYEVSKRIFAKWYHDTVYCVQWRTLQRSVDTT